MPVVYENIQVGHWYAIYEIETGDQGEGWYTPRKNSYDGHPFKVIACSFPFVFGKAINGRCMTIDVRTVTLTSVNDRFVKAWKRDFEERGCESMQSDPKKRRRKKEKPDPHSCLRCGSRIVQKLTKQGWRFACRDCGFDCGPVTVDS